MNARYIGLIVGLVAGTVWMALGFERLVVVLVLGALGYAIGGVVAGEIDVQRFIDAWRRR